jgi:hypothetical protein
MRVIPEAAALAIIGMLSTGTYAGTFLPVRLHLTPELKTGQIHLPRQ